MTGNITMENFSNFFANTMDCILQGLFCMVILIHLFIRYWDSVFYFTLYYKENGLITEPRMRHF